jgi:hypothetical protein
MGGMDDVEDSERDLCGKESTDELFKGEYR